MLSDLLNQGGERLWVRRKKGRFKHTEEKGKAEGGREIGKTF